VDYWHKTVFRIAFWDSGTTNREVNTL
jgi:hypothetical protein